MSPSSEPARESVRAHVAYLLAVFLAMGALLWSFAADEPWRWLLPDYVVIEIDQTFYRVPEGHLRNLSETPPDWLSAAERTTRERLEDGVERSLSRLFGEVHGRVPMAADWYYSLEGVSLRLLAAIPNPLWSGGEGLMGRTLAARLFPEDVWTAELAALERELDQLRTRELTALEHQWLAWLVRELEPYRQNAVPPAGEDVLRFDRNLHLHLTDLLGVDRIGTQTVVGLGSGALLARAAVARVNAATASGRAAARLAARGTAGSGTAACGLTGPLAIGCAVVVFAGVTLGTEWAFLQVDEALNRKGLEQALHDGVDALHEAMAAEYGARWLEAFEQDAGVLGTGIRASLRPVDRVTAAAAR